MKEPEFDLVGRKFQSLTVLNEYERKHIYNGTRILWKVRCDCGNTFFLGRNQILKRKQNFCENCRPIARRNTRLYHIYHGIIQRCENPNAPGYEYYGGRGIKMVEEWRNDYESFKEWSLANGYKERAGLSIDRINNDGNYEPNNCQWITIAENTAKSDRGKAKNHSKMKDMYAISPDGVTYVITNIAQFAREHPEMNKPCIHAVLHGRLPNPYWGWIFHSDQTRPPLIDKSQEREGVTTIENASAEKAC